MWKNMWMAWWEWEGMKPPHFPFLTHSKQKAYVPKYTIETKTGIREKWRSLDIFNLIFSCFWYRCESTGYLFHGVHEEQQQVRWNTSTWDFVAVSEREWDYENNQRDWKGKGNKTWLNPGAGMGMNHWKLKGVGLEKTFPLVSSSIKRGETCSAVADTSPRAPLTYSVEFRPRRTSVYKVCP